MSQYLVSFSMYDRAPAPVLIISLTPQDGGQPSYREFPDYLDFVDAATLLGFENEEILLITLGLIEGVKSDVLLRDLPPRAEELFGMKYPQPLVL